jgi:hypothetical protein
MSTEQHGATSRERLAAEGCGHDGDAVTAGNQPNTDLIHGTGIEIWGSASWRALAVSWMDSQLATAGAVRTGEAEQRHLRPWATALKAPTTRGPVWLKAAGPGTAFEIGLYKILRQVVPDRVLTPIAIDVPRGWIILPDGGPTLGDQLSGGDLIEALVKIMPQYGQLQRDLCSRVDDLLALGVADMRAAAMPARFDQALEAVSGYVARRGTATERAAYQRIAPLRATFVSWCQQLAAAPAAPSLDHNDLHAWNIFAATADGHTRAKFYDWGDSVVAHPFASMLIGLGFMVYQFKIDPGGRQILRVRDAYLEAFSDIASHAELVVALELACRVGKVARALTWNRALEMLGDDEAGQFASAPIQCLVSLLESSYLGGA